MTQVLNNIQEIPKKVSGHGINEVAIVQMESADSDFWNAQIMQLAVSLTQQGKRVDWYWYPKDITANEFEIEIKDLEPHYEQIIVMPDRS
jgi:hypothetical protein